MVRPFLSSRYRSSYLTLLHSICPALHHSINQVFEHGEREKAKPLLSIDELLFDESQSNEDTETGLLAFGAKQLRTTCYCRQLRIVKSGAECNGNKLGYVALLMKLKRAYAEMQQLQVEGEPPKAMIGAVHKRKSRHCIPRLLNVIFSDRFAHRLPELEQRPTRAELDTSQTQASSSIWVQIHEEFLSSSASRVWDSWRTRRTVAISSPEGVYMLNKVVGLLKLCPRKLILAEKTYFYRCQPSCLGLNWHYPPRRPLLYISLTTTLV
eukprot:jgi/Phyca11/112141/e_gw1.21.563.1